MTELDETGHLDNKARKLKLLAFISIHLTSRLDIRNVNLRLFTNVFTEVKCLLVERQLLLIFLTSSSTDETGPLYDKKQAPQNVCICLLRRNKPSRWRKGAPQIFSIGFHRQDDLSLQQIRSDQILASSFKDEMDYTDDRNVHLLFLAFVSTDETGHLKDRSGNLRLLTNFYSDEEWRFDDINGHLKLLPSVSTNEKGDLFPTVPM